MSHALLPRRTALAVTSSLALAVAGAATATPALAGSWEEVTRASGAQGAAPLFNTSYALAVSDNARYAVFQHVKFGVPASIKYYVRDTIADTTRELAAGTITGFYGIDRAGQHALVLRNDAASQTLLLVPLAGGTPKVLLTSDMFVSAALSGDGKTVVYSEGQVATSEPVDATYKLNVATGAKTKIDNVAVELTPNSISDDGSVIAGKIAADQRGVYYRGTAKTVTPSKTIVSPNGAIVVAYNLGSSTGRTVLARRLSDGYTKTLPVAADATDIAWIAPDGLQIAFGSNREHDPILPAQVLNLASGALTPLGGPYAKALDQSYLLGPNDESTSGTAISRSGRYAVTRLNERGNLPLAIVDIQNGDLPGTEAPASASAYVAAGMPLRFTCPEDNPVYTTAVNYNPPQWIAPAKRLEIVIKADGVKLADYGFDHPTGESGVNVEVPDGTSLVTYDIKVIDAANRTLITKDSAAPVSYCSIW